MLEGFPLEILGGRYVNVNDRVCTDWSTVKARDKPFPPIEHGRKHTTSLSDCHAVLRQVEPPMRAPAVISKIPKPDPYAIMGKLKDDVSLKKSCVVVDEICGRS